MCGAVLAASPSLGEKGALGPPPGPVIYRMANRRNSSPQHKLTADVCPGTICTDVKLNSLQCP